MFDFSEQFTSMTVTAVTAPLVAVMYLNEVPITPPGHRITKTWAGLDGATSVEVDSLPFTLASGIKLKSLGTLLVTPAGNSFDITIPESKHIRSLTLTGLRQSGGTADLRNEGDLQTAGLRLVVTTISGGHESAPLFSVPDVNPGGMLPLILTGASYASGVLNLPDLAAAKIRLSLVTGSQPHEFSKQGMALGQVSGMAALLPTNLRLLDSDNAVAWQAPDEFLESQPIATADVRVSAAKILTAKLKAGAPLETTFTLVGDAEGVAKIHFGGVTGRILRTFSGVTTMQLEGIEQRPTLAAPPLSSEAAASVIADLSVKYLGIRVLDEFFDPIPTAGGANGVVVSSQPALRSLPPAALRPHKLVRVGIIGRAPAACELSVQLVEAINGGIGKPIGSPGVVTLEPSNTIGLIWVTLPTPLDHPTTPVAITIRANTGRFLWASGDQPFIRLAVEDPDPGGRALLLNGTRLVNIATTESHQPNFALPAGAFRGTVPVFDSRLFLKVDLSDLTLRYTR